MRIPMFARRAAALLVLAPAVFAQEFREESVAVEEGPFAGRSFRYRVFVPDDVGEGEQLPVLLFLHGAGERGDDNQAQLRHLPERMVREDYRDRFRGIVVAPQCARGEMWMKVDWSKRESESAVSEDSPWLDVAMAALRRTLAEEACDPARIYLTGLSMGGFGSWHLAARAPDLFAGMVAVCGGGDPASVPSLRDLPIQAWHGAADNAVSPQRSRAMVRAVREAGGIAHYVELPGVGHDSWNAAYALSGGALDWLWSRRRGERYLGRVMACDQAVPRLVLLELDRDWADPGAVVWEWRGESLSEEQRAWFVSPTDAKPVDLGTALIATASDGGVFKVRIPDGEVLFAAHVGGNPHSVAELPDGSLVVASSAGNVLTRFDPSRGPDPLESIALSNAHGVHWDDAHAVLWALGAGELLGLALEDDDLVERHRLALPAAEGRASPGGHDLVALRGSGLLGLSGATQLWTFDPGARRFAPFAPLPEAARVKSLGALRPGGPFVLLQAGESWWSDRARFVGAGELERRLPGARFYKLRPWQ